MSDLELLDLLFDGNNGLLNDQLSVPKTNNSQSQLELRVGNQTRFDTLHQHRSDIPAVTDKHHTMNSLGLDVFADPVYGNDDLDWSPTFLQSSLSLDGLDQNEFFNSLMDTNVPDEVKEQKQLQQPPTKQCFDHAYSITPGSPNSDSGVSTGPYSPSNSSNSIEDLPFDIEQELFAPLDLKSYEDIDGNTPTADPMLLDSFSDNGSSPGLVGNESPINFDFEDLEHSSSHTAVKGLTISTDETTKVIKVLSVNGSHTSLLSSNNKISSNSPYPELMLSDEEKNLLRKEGIALPSHLPLTREEEKILRSVRRRIRNKASARNSRRKKQDYMEALEKRVKLCTDEKRQLEKKVNELEKRNSSLIGQLKKLQRLVTDGTRQTAKTGTCAMILALSFALVLLPNYQTFMGNDSSATEDTTLIDSTADITGRPSRSLLSKPEDYISSVSQEKTFYPVPFLNFNHKAPQVSAVDNSVVDTADHKAVYVHDPIDEVEGSSKYEPSVPSAVVDEQVIHMEITKLPDEPPSATVAQLNNISDRKLDIQTEDTVHRHRAIRMDLEDEL